MSRLGPSTEVSNAPTIIEARRHRSAQVLINLKVCGTIQDLNSNDAHLFLSFPARATHTTCSDNLLLCFQNKFLRLQGVLPL